MKNAIQVLNEALSTTINESLQRPKLFIFKFSNQLAIIFNKLKQ
jgi:hypothetical protein